MTATVLMTLLVGIAQVGIIYYAVISVDTAAREGARVVAANPGNSGLFSGVNSPLIPGSHTCTGTTDPIRACKAVYNSTHNGAPGGLINPANLTVSLVGSQFAGSSPAACSGGAGTSDGVVSVTVGYNAPIFIPILGNLLSTGGNNYRTVTTTVLTRVEPCINTNGA